MKIFNSKIVAVNLLLATGFIFSSCEKNSLSAAGEQYAAVLSVSADGTSTVVDATLKAAFIPTAALDVTDLSILTKMKDEEKLARDVYTTLSNKFGGTVFTRISDAESRHLNAIVLLLANYGLTETIAAPGVYDDQAFNALYTTLVAKGSTTLSDAYSVGAMIEEMDIKDLMDASQQVKNENVLMVFENLTRGSRNHLRAFNFQLVNLGVIYQPVYLDLTTFQGIINGQFEKGKQYRMNNGVGNCGNGTGNGNGMGKGKGKG